MEFPALLTEFHRDIDRYLATRPEGPRDLAELIAYNRSDPLEQTCFAGQELFEQALVAPGPADPGYPAMRRELTDLAKRSIDETLAHGRAMGGRPRARLRGRLRTRRPGPETASLPPDRRMTVVYPG